MDSYLIKKCPSRAYYIPNFIGEAEEELLIKNVYESPKPKWTQLKNRRLQNWGGQPHVKGMISESIPEWLNIYCEQISRLGVFETCKPNHILINEYLPGQGLLSNSRKLSIFKISKSKMNLFFFKGIMPHVDGPLYYRTVSTISLGSHTLLDFYEPLDTGDELQATADSSLQSRFKFSLLLEPRSLLVLQDKMYDIYLHGIKETMDDCLDQEKIFNLENIANVKYIQPGAIFKRDCRVSLTIRNVPKVIKLNKNLNLFLNNKK